MGVRGPPTATADVRPMTSDIGSTVRILPKYRSARKSGIGVALITLNGAVDR